MPAPRATDINQFLNRRRDNWNRLEALLQRVEAGGLRGLPPAEAREFGVLYRRASSDLVTARAKTANAEILEYLNDLVARSYAQIYRSRRFRPRDILTFLLLDFPRLFRHCWKYMALSGFIMAAAVVFGWEMSRRDPAGAYYMLPPQFVKAIPTIRENWRHRTGHETSMLTPHEMAITSSWLMTHNIGVGYVALGGGALFGLPTLWALILNGALLGILGQAMSTSETGLVFWSLILPHGVIELTAIAIFGGAGFVIAGALLAPGRRSRRDALIERGRLAIMLALGATAMLVLAGLIEGIITPPDFIPPVAKLLFALGTLIGLLAYFGFAGRGSEPGLLAGLAYEEGQEAAAVL
jgi:uncharacterized membrane protein SpoIIM required for sporulation